MFTEFFEFFTHPLGLLVLAFFAVGFVFTRGRGGAVAVPSNIVTDEDESEEIKGPLDLRAGFDFTYGPRPND